MQIAIIGLGLIGGSLAKALKENTEHTVIGFDRDENTLLDALSLGAIDSVGSTSLLENADVVYVCLYPADVVRFVEENAPHFKEGCIVTDVCGIKNQVCGKLTEIAKNYPFVYVGGHPMAGKERSGVENAHLVDFAPANFLITPTEKNTEAGVEFARGLAKALGFAHIHVISPEEHDRMIGYVSQLTHAIAVSLMCAPNAERFADYTGDSFRDLTRIAYLNAPMWAELFLWNRDCLVEEIDAFTARLQQLKGYLQAGQREELEAMFRASSAARTAFDKKEKEG